MAYIEFNQISKEYITGETTIKALDEASFIVEKGELAVVLGSSGAGKTTALNKLKTNRRLFLRKHRLRRFFLLVPLPVCCDNERIQKKNERRNICEKIFISYFSTCLLAEHCFRRQL